MLPSLAFGFVALTGQARFDFYSHGPYDASVPRPESILRYSPGEHETPYESQDRVVRAITQAASTRTKYITFGESVEGRPLRIVAISSPENIARLESIRGDIATLASGTGKDTDAIVKRTVPIVWINECIHGNEPASFESAMWLIYTLAASQEPAIQSALSKAVVIVNPSYNPDGHERFVDWYNSVATGSSDPDAFEQREPEVVYGRFNHYRFDMNRDRVAMSQPETRQEVAEFLKWTPQVYVDQHGQVTTYFFPPTSMSVNANVDRARYAKWTEVFGRATGKAFDANGFPYYIKDIFDLYYPGYLDSWSTLSGAIGMTHETDGPKSLARRESDGAVLTLRGGIEKHFTSAIAVVEATAANGPDLLRSFADFKRRSASGEHAGKERFVVAKGDPESLERLQEQLSRSGIRSMFPGAQLSLKKARSAWGRGLEDVDIPSGQALVIPMAQPQGALARALLQDASDFEPEFVQEQMRRRKQAAGPEQYPQADSAEFYDLTAWGLLYAHDLDGWWVESLPSAARTQVLPAPGPDRTAALSDRAAIGWGILPSEDGSTLAFRLMQDGVRLQATTREMKIEGKTFPAGTFMVLRSRNSNTPEEQSALVSKVEKDSQDFRGEIVALHTSYPDEGRQGPGSESVSTLRTPSLGVVFGDDSSTTDFGALWYLLERELKLPFTPLHKDALAGDISRFSCIVFPDGSYDAPSDKLKDWISRGGCAVVLGGARWALGDKGFFKLDQSKIDKDKTPASLPGSIFKAELDPRSFLSFGYPHKGDEKIPIAVPVEGSRYYKAKPEGGGAIVFSSATNKLLSGWEWPGETETALSGTVWLHDEPTGRGHVVWFSQDPTQRAMWPGLTRLLLNAIVYGPS